MKLLLIDNKPLTGEMLSFMLKRERPEIEYLGQAYSAREGYRMAAELSPDILIVDFAAPGMCEENALLRLGEVASAAHVIVRTAYDEFSCMRQALRAGVKDYLLVPVRTEEMLDALDRCAGKEVPDRVSAAPEGGELNAASLMRLITEGQVGYAIQSVAQWLRSQHPEGSIERSCARFLDLATQLIQLPGLPKESQDEISLLYQELVHSLALVDAPEVLLDQAGNYLNRFAALLDRSSRDPGHHQIAAAKEYIENHLGSRLSLDLVASKLFLSPGYFSRLFKQKTGLTFSEYLANRRIDRAKLLLTTSDLQISEIAKQLGYAEPNSFTRLFRLKTGLSPSQYREQ